VSIIRNYSELLLLLPTVFYHRSEELSGLHNTYIYIHTYILWIHKCHKDIEEVLNTQTYAFYRANYHTYLMKCIIGHLYK